MKKRRTKTWDEEPLCLPDSDAQFAYIAGYTEGDFPYGITWEEHWDSQGGHNDKADDLGDIFPDDLMNRGAMLIVNNFDN